MKYKFRVELKRLAAKCDFCDQDMTVADSCTEEFVVYPDNTHLPVSRYHFDEPDGRCNDCGIKHGGAHHPGCDVERCPKCGGQLIGCACLE